MQALGPAPPLPGPHTAWILDSGPPSLGAAARPREGVVLGAYASPRADGPPGWLAIAASAPPEAATRLLAHARAVGSALAATP